MATNYTNEHESGFTLRVHLCHSWLIPSLLAVILLASLALSFNNLGHAGVKDLDEAYHAIAARSLIDDPLRPTLYATPYLPYDFQNWQANHVWLHKPPVALWQMAASMAVFGESNFTMRLPSALLAAAAVALTFFIGRSLITAEAGLVAAALQALAPAITRLVHGEVFADHVDVAMLFWSELAVLSLIRAARTGTLAAAALVGAVQAIAWMTKSYPALFVAGLATLLVIVGRWMRDGNEAQQLRFSIRQLAVLIGAFVITIAPWVTWCLVHYRREFLFEQFHVVTHLYTNVESFAAPWDRLLADYLQRGFLEWYPLVIVAGVTIAVDSIHRRDSRRLFIAAWAIGVLVPHLFAVTKTPTATLIGWPAGWIAIGVLVSDALRGLRFAIGALFATAVVLIIWPQRPIESVIGYGTDYHFGRIALEQWRLAATAIVIAAAGLIARAIRCERSTMAPTPKTTTLGITVAILLLYPVGRYAQIAIATSRDVPTDPIAFPKLGQIVRKQSPPNAVFLVDVQSRGEPIIAMWWLDRACYPLSAETLDADLAAIRSRGGKAFVLSRFPQPTVPLVKVEGEGAIYAIEPPDPDR